MRATRKGTSAAVRGAFGAALMLALAALLGAFAANALGAGAAPDRAALGPPAERTIDFAGHSVKAPRTWPVIRLARHPGTCVRLDRRAVYLGTPSSHQRCPADAIGARRAILVEPRPGASISALAAPSSSGATTSAGGEVFTGLGFDACSTPSSRSMDAWAESPYRAIGVYVGGANRACSQPNLTEAWVEEVTAAGWHLIPTYVGLQAPTSSCSSCAKLSSSSAVAQGTSAAVDAVAQAATVGIGPGSPIYFDMESYSQTSAATSAVLAFEQAWTDKLHALGYLSGVYSSSSSGIADLADQVGGEYRLPDDIWTANWNNQKNTADPQLPASGWALHQRIHQYAGGHNETYGGITINIDNDYVDAATASGSGAPGEDDPVGFLDLSRAAPGTIRVKGWAFDPNLPTAPLAIRVSVGGKAGAPGASEYELGPVATQTRKDVAAEHPEAGPAHGFDSSFATTAAGTKAVCVYAVGISPGADTLLGCKPTRVPVAITFSDLRAVRGGVKVRMSCAWPAGTECPGYLSLRTRFRVAAHRRVKVVTRSLGRRAFHLAGGHSHAYTVPLSAGGRAVLALRGKLRTQLIAAIPGGRRYGVLALERPAR